MAQPFLPEGYTDYDPGVGIGSQPISAGELFDVAKAGYYQQQAAKEWTEIARLRWQGDKEGAAARHKQADSLDAYADFYTDLLSPTSKQTLQEGFWDTNRKGRSAALSVAQSLPATLEGVAVAVPSMVAGGLVGGPAGAVGAGMVAGAAHEGYSAVGAILKDVYKELNNLGEEKLAEIPLYKQLRDQGISHRDALREVTYDAGFTNSVVTGMLTGLAGGLFNEAGALTAPVMRSAVKGTILGYLKKVGKGTLMEGAEEGVQGINESLGRQEALQTALPGQFQVDPLEAAKEGVEGAVVGGITGAGFSMVPGRGPRREALTVTPPIGPDPAELAAVPRPPAPPGLPPPAPGAAPVMTPWGPSAGLQPSGLPGGPPQPPSTQQSVGDLLAADQNLALEDRVQPVDPARPPNTPMAQPRSALDLEAMDQNLAGPQSSALAPPPAPGARSAMSAADLAAAEGEGDAGPTTPSGYARFGNRYPGPVDLMNDPTEGPEAGRLPGYDAARPYGERMTSWGTPYTPTPVPKVAATPKLTSETLVGEVQNVLRATKPGPAWGMFVDALEAAVRYQPTASVSQVLDNTLLQIVGRNGALKRELASRLGGVGDTAVARYTEQGQPITVGQLLTNLEQWLQPEVRPATSEQDRTRLGPPEPTMRKTATVTPAILEIQRRLTREDPRVEKTSGTLKRPTESKFEPVTTERTERKLSTEAMRQGEPLSPSGAEKALEDTVQEALTELTDHAQTDDIVKSIVNDIRLETEPGKGIMSRQSVGQGVVNLIQKPLAAWEKDSKLAREVGTNNSGDKIYVGTVLERVHQILQRSNPLAEDREVKPGISKTAAALVAERVPDAAQAPGSVGEAIRRSSKSDSARAKLANALRDLVRRLQYALQESAKTSGRGELKQKISRKVLREQRLLNAAAREAQGLSDAVGKFKDRAPGSVELLARAIVRNLPKLAELTNSTPGEIMAAITRGRGDLTALVQALGDSGTLHSVPSVENVPDAEYEALLGAQPRKGGVPSAPVTTSPDRRIGEAFKERAAAKAAEVTTTITEGDIEPKPPKIMARRGARARMADEARERGKQAMTPDRVAELVAANPVKNKELIKRNLALRDDAVKTFGHPRWQDIVSNAWNRLPGSAQQRAISAYGWAITVPMAGTEVLGATPNKVLSDIANRMKVPTKGLYAFLDGIHAAAEKRAGTVPASPQPPGATLPVQPEPGGTVAERAERGPGAGRSDEGGDTGGAEAPAQLATARKATKAALAKAEKAKDKPAIARLRRRKKAIEQVQEVVTPDVAPTDETVKANLNAELAGFTPADLADPAKAEQAAVLEEVGAFSDVAVSFSDAVSAAGFDTRGDPNVERVARAIEAVAPGKKGWSKLTPREQGAALKLLADLKSFPQSFKQIRSERGQAISQGIASARLRSMAGGSYRDAGVALQAVRRALFDSGVRRPTLRQLLTPEVLAAMPPRLQALTSQALAYRGIADVPVRWVSDLEEGEVGRYMAFANDPGFVGWINLTREAVVDPEQFTETLLHEMVHANGMLAVEQDRALFKSTGHRTPEFIALGKVVQQLYAAHNTTQDPELRHAINAALENPTELLSWGLTNQKLVEALQATPASPELATMALGFQPNRPVSLWRTLVGLWRRYALGLKDDYKSVDSLLNTLNATYLRYAERQQTLRANSTARSAEASELLAASQNMASRATAAIATSLETRTAPPAVANRIDTMGESGRRGLLGMMTMENIAELYGQAFEIVGRAGNALKDVIGAARLIANAVTTRMRQADEINRAWNALASQNQAANQQMQHLMYESTMFKFDASQPIDAPINKVVARDDARSARHAQAARQFNALPKEFQDLYRRVRDFYTTERRDVIRLILRNFLTPQFVTNPSDEQRAIVEQYAADVVDGKASLDKPPGQWAPLGPVARKLAGQILNVNRVPGAYFPARRVGDYVVTFKEDVDRTFATNDELNAFLDTWPSGDRVTKKNPDGSHTVKGTIQHTEFFETINDARGRRVELVAAVTKDGFDAGRVSQVLTREKRGELRSMPDHLYEAVKKALQQSYAGEPAQLAKITGVLDETLYRYMPDTFVQKAELRRRYVGGAMPDMHRAFAKYSTGSSYFLANLEHNWRSREALSEARKTVKAASYDEKKPDLQRKLHDVLAEVEGRVYSNQEYTAPNWVVARASQAASMWLLVSPSYYMIQLSQPWVFGLPMIGARYGFADTAGALGRAANLVAPRALLEGGKRMRDMLAASDNPDDIIGLTIKSLRERKRDDLANLLKALADQGQIDYSHVEDLQRDARAHSGASNKIDAVVAFSRVGAHATEIASRSLVAIATYELAMKKYAADHGMTSAAAAKDEAAIAYATEQASEMVSKSQANYQDWNTARLMNPKTIPALKLAWQFKKYAQHVYAMLAINGVKMWKAADPADRAEARRAVLGLLTSHFLMAGALGIVVEPIAWVIGFAMKAMGADDSDYEDDVQNFFHDLLGPELGEIVSRGLPRALGFDLSGRVTLRNLMMMGDLGDLERDGPAAFLGRVLTGAVGGTVMDMPKALQAFETGDMRALEYLVPKLVRDAWRTYRFAEEGMLDTNGHPIIKPEDMGFSEFFAQAMGFRPASVARATERRSAIMSAQKIAATKRSELLELYARSDPSERSALRANQIPRFNAEYGELAITDKVLKRSMESREKRNENMLRNAGVYVPDTQRLFLDAGRFGAR